MPGSVPAPLPTVAVRFEQSQRGPNSRFANSRSLGSNLATSTAGHAHTRMPGLVLVREGPMRKGAESVWCCLS
eukprot:1992422-Rhodomonas_salina.2